MNKILKKFIDISNKTTIFDVKDDIKHDINDDIKHDDTYNISIKKRSMDYLSKKIKNENLGILSIIPSISFLSLF